MDLVGGGGGGGGEEEEVGAVRSEGGGVAAGDYCLGVGGCVSCGFLGSGFFAGMGGVFSVYL